VWRVDCVSVSEARRYVICDSDASHNRRKNVLSPQLKYGFLHVMTRETVDSKSTSESRPNDRCLWIAGARRQKIYGEMQQSAVVQGCSTSRSLMMLGAIGTPQVSSCFIHGEALINRHAYGSEECQ